ncbi:hypothetical protein [Aeoliella sp. SH292]|uniref:hypothetical protein n=1 Tax=Aeoliella sp. SH292 TaxID=3454464 RepID=UPI003F990963
MHMASNYLNIAAALGAHLVAFTLSASALEVGTPVSWNTPTNGSWSNGAKWSLGFAPDNGQPQPGDIYDVTFASTGTAHRVVLEGDVEINTLTIDSPDATFSLGIGSLRAEQINLTRGTMQMGHENTIVFASESKLIDATIIGTAGQLSLSGGPSRSPVFENVKLGLDVQVPSSGTSPPRAFLVVRGGLELLDDSTLQIYGFRAEARFEGNQTLAGNGQIEFAQALDFGGRTGTMMIADNSTLTIGPDVEIVSTNLGGSVGDRAGEWRLSQNIALRNYGLISGKYAGQQSMEIMNVDEDSSAVFENYGIVEAHPGATVTVAANWTNHGVFRLHNGGTLVLDGKFTLDDIGSIERDGGTLRIAGEVDNVGRTFTASAATGDLVVSNGQSNYQTGFRGGTLAATDGAKWEFGSASLDDVALEADISLVGPGRVQVINDLTLDGSTVSMTGTEYYAPAVLDFRDAQQQSILGNGTVLIAGASGLPSNNIDIRQELVITSGITVETAGGSGKFVGGRLVNEGLIRANQFGRIEITTDDFVNRGVVDIAGFGHIGGDQSARWTNDGTIFARAGSTVRLGGHFTVDDLGQFVDQGASVIDLLGVLDLEGGTLDLADLPFERSLRLFGGALRDGTIRSSQPDTLSFSSADSELINITIAGDLKVPIGGRIHITGDLVLDNSKLDMGTGTQLYFSDNTPQAIRGTGEIIMTGVQHIGGSGLTDGVILGEGITLRTGAGTGNTSLSEFRNEGTILVSGLGRIVTFDGENWHNAGVVRIEQQGRLELSGVFTTDDIGNLIVAQGIVELDGLLDNSGRTLELGTDAASWQFQSIVRGGTIKTTTSVPSQLCGRFEQVTLAGQHLIGNYHQVTTDTQASFVGGLTLDDATLTLNSGRHILVGDTKPASIAGTGQIVLNGPPTTTGVHFTGTQAMSIQPDVTVRTGATGGGTLRASSGGLTNHGTIEATTGYGLLIAGAFENHGTLEAANFGTVEVSASSWVNHGTIIAGPRNRGGGGIVLTGTQFRNAAGGVLTGEGHFRIPLGTVINEGTISPGDEIGQLSLTGVLSMRDSTIVEIDLGGALGTNSDLLWVSGSAQLAGELKVKIDPSFTWTPGTTIEILRSSTGILTGQFANAPDFLQARGVLFAVEYSAQTVSLVAIAVPECSTALLALFAMLASSTLLRRRRS